MTQWPDIDWSKTMGGNDRFGDCAFVACSNLVDLWRAPQIVSEAEAEYFYNVEAGFNSQDAATDKGAILEQVIRYWCDHGWPGDSTMRPSGYETVPLGQAPLIAAMQRFGAVLAAVELPEDQDFTDDAVIDSAPGAFGHAVLVVSADDDGVRLVSWARIVLVSWRWWADYARQAFGIAEPSLAPGAS